MEGRIAKTLIVFFILPGLMAVFSGCASNRPVPMKKPDSVEHSYSQDQVRSQEGVELLIQNKDLEKVLVISDVALVRGKYVRQFNARISNVGKHTLEIRTEPVWFDGHGVQMHNVYSQGQVHRLGSGQGVSISHDAVSSAARTVRLIVDCPSGGCRVED